MATVPTIPGPDPDTRKPSSVGTIPAASVGFVLGIHRLMSEALTPTNLVGNAVATIVVSRWEGVLDQARLRSALDGGPRA